MRTDRKHKNKLLRSWHKHEDELIEVTQENAQRLFNEQQKLPPEQMNAALVDKCVDVLLGDEKVPIEDSVKAETWNGILQEIRNTDRRSDDPRRYGKIRPAVVLAAALCVILTAGVCFAAGWLPWKLQIAWNDDKLDVRIVYSDWKGLSSQSTVPPTGLSDTLDQALTEHGMTILLPTWIPARFTFDGVETQEVDKYSSSLVASFVSGEQSLSIFIDQYQLADGVNGTIESSYEKSGEEVETYSVGTTEYYIYSNLNMNCAIWHCENYEVNIVGNITRNELKYMLDSIGEGE